MHIAVTGASGFLGTHVLEALAGKVHRVTAVSRKKAAASPAGNVRWLQFDLHRAGLKTYRALGSPDLLLHLAWDGLPNYRDRFHLDRELPAQRAFLDACLDGGLRRLAVSGTCLEYGLAEGQLAEDLPAKPMTAYAEAKHALRSHLLRRRDGDGFGLAWFRLFYLHGRGQSPLSLLPTLERAISDGAGHFDMSPGDQVRDFTPVAFAANVLVRIAMAHPDAGTVNICSGRGQPVASFVRSRLAELGARLELRTGTFPYPDYEPLRAWGSRARMDQLLEQA